MNKIQNVAVVTILIMNFIMSIMLYQQSNRLAEYEHLLTNIEGKLEDLDDAIEKQIK